MQRNWNSHTMLVEKQSVQQLWKTTATNSTKTKYTCFL